MVEENKKWYLVTLVLAGVVMTWVLGEFLKFTGGYFNLGLRPIVGVFPPYHAISAIINFLLVIYVIKRQDVGLFANEVVMEIKKVTWPTRSDTWKSTLVVIIAVIISAAILWIYDSVLTWVLKRILG